MSDSVLYAYANLDSLIAFHLVLVSYKVGPIFPEHFVVHLFTSTYKPPFMPSLTAFWYSSCELCEFFLFLVLILVGEFRVSGADLGLVWPRRLLVTLVFLGDPLRFCSSVESQPIIKVRVVLLGMDKEVPGAWSVCSLKSVLLTDKRSTGPLMRVWFVWRFGRSPYTSWRYVRLSRIFRIFSLTSSRRLVPSRP